MSLAAEAPVFPPLLRGEAVAPGQAMAKAMAKAALGTEPGLVTWAATPERLEAAIVLAPELPLERAIGVSFAVMLGIGDAIGALGPPEVAVHYDWPGGLRVGGARCGRLRAAASTDDPAAEPDWLVLALEVALAPPPGTNTGAHPQETWLSEEGCGEITADRLIESWSRHSLVWINSFTDQGLGPLHEAWHGRAWGIGEALPDGGVFVGLDEHGGQLVRTAAGTELRPLSRLIEAP